MNRSVCYDRLLDEDASRIPTDGIRTNHTVNVGLLLTTDDGCDVAAIAKTGTGRRFSYRINTLAGSAPRSLNTLTHPKAYKHAVNKPAPADETENLTPHQPAEPPAQTPRLCGARARESHSPRKRRRLRGVPDTRSTHTRTPDGVTTGERGREIPGMPRSWNQAGGSSSAIHTPNPILFSYF